jgi:hypothetical protein
MSFNVMAQNIHYFGSIKASQTSIDDNDVKYDSISNKMTIAPLTTAGFSFDANLNDKYQALAQFIYINNSTIAVDLLQLRYHFTPDLAVRVGRQRLPTNLHSENIQVQALLPWMTAPREVYGRIPIYSFTGGSLEQSLGENFGLHLYAGDTKDKFVNGDVEYDTAASNLYGGRLNFKAHQFNAFVNAYRAEAKVNVKTDVDAAVNGGATNPGTTVGLNQKYSLENVTGLATGFQYRPKQFFLMSEYYVITSDSPAIARAEGAYVSVGKEINEKWIPVATFSTDLDVESQLSPTKTATYMFNLNYRLDYNNILKIGVEHVNYKERTVATSNFPPTSNASVFTNSSPGENFEVYSLMWAFVY